MGQRIVRTIHTARQAAKAAVAIARGHTVMAQRGEAVNCAGCQTPGMAARGYRISRQGAVPLEPTPPDGWGVRYERCAAGEPRRDFYCATCAVALASGEMKPCPRT